jgi:hypothetical protein
MRHLVLGLGFGYKQGAGALVGIALIIAGAWTNIQ